MWNRFVIANLRRRPLRSLVSILAVAIEVALILLIVGLTNGMVRDNRTRLAGIGADIVVRANSSSMFMALSGNTLPLKLGSVLGAVPDVAAVAPVAAQMNGNNLQTVQGIDLASFDAVSGGFQYLRGGPFRGPWDMIIDNLEAADDHYHVGESVMLLAHKFTVTGIVEHGKGSRIYIPLATLDLLAGTPDKANAFYLKLANPAETNTVVATLQAKLPGYSILPMQEYLSLFTASNIPGLPLFQKIMIGIAVIIGLLVIFLSLYTSILERTREIGILKSLGASRTDIVQIVLRETALLAVLGIGGGTAIAAIVQHVLQGINPTLTIELTLGWVGRAAVIALIGSACGALYPAFKAAGQDAIAALAYE